MAKLCIDGNKLLELLSEQLVKETGAFSKGVNKGLNISRSLIRNPDAVKPIDPETLPIVRQLREELARVTAERDAAQRLLAEHTGVVGMEKVTTCFGCPLDKVLELVMAYRDGRIIMRQEKGKEANL